MRKIEFSDYDGRAKPSVEQRLHALYSPVNVSGRKTDGQEQSSEYHEESSVSSLDEIDWDQDEVILGNY